MNRPKSAVNTDQYTNGEEFVYIINNPNSIFRNLATTPISKRGSTKYENYIGYYHSYSNGDTFTGKDHNSADIKKLFPAKVAKKITNINDTLDRSTLVSLTRIYMETPSPDSNTSYLSEPSITNNLVNYKQYLKPGSNANVDMYIGLKGGDPNINIRHPLATKTQPTEKDYENEFFLRYFCIKNNESKILELSYEEYKLVKTKKITIAHEFYTPFILKWKLVGNSREEVIKTNKQVVKNLIESPQYSAGPAKKYFFALENYFEGNYDEYYQITPGIVTINKTRAYPDGTFISFNLPEVYQLGNNYNKNINSKVPPKQNCSNCSFFKAKNCTKWQAIARNEYWCAAYSGSHGKGYIIDEIDTNETQQQTLNQEYLQIVNNNIPQQNNNIPQQNSNINYSPSTGGY